MKRIGERIKKKRDQFNLQLNELAENVGITPSALSQIEKGKSFPSIVTLKNIAQELHTTVSELIGENESLTSHPVVTTSEVRLMGQNKSGTQFFQTSHPDASKQMDTYIVKFIQDSDINGFFTITYGQIYSYVISGEVEYELDGKTYLLKKGDNIYFNSKYKFGAKNKQNGESEIIWIISPPHF